MTSSQNNSTELATDVSVPEEGSANAVFNPSFADEVKARKEQKALAKKKKLKRIFVAVLFALLALVIAAALGVFYMLNSGKQNLLQAPTDVETVEEAITYDEGRTIEYNGAEYVLNENVVSVCIIGYGGFGYGEKEGRAGEADAVMVVALDTSTGKATMISIPRDSMVEVGEHVGSAFLGMDTMQLCLAYSYGDGAETSCEYVTSIVQRILYNMPMRYYFAVNMEGVGPMADAVGGVALTALTTIPYPEIHEGEDVVLRGENALSYLRWRDASKLDSSLDRQERQIQFIKAYASQVLEAARDDARVLADLFETASNYSVTNLTIGEFVYLASCMMANGINSLEAMSLDGELREENGYAAVYLDRDSVYEAVLNVYYTKMADAAAESEAFEGGDSVDRGAAVSEAVK